MAHVVNRKADFTRVRSLYESNDCTPELDGQSLQGIAINLPEQTTLPAGSQGTLAEAGVVLRLCGACRFEHGFLRLRGSFVDHILFVAVDARTHVPRAGKMAPVPNAIPSPDPDDGLEPDMLVGEVFNPDLAELLGLPACEAEYIVYASLGPHRSNVLTTRVQLENEP